MPRVNELGGGEGSRSLSDAEYDLIRLHPISTEFRPRINALVFHHVIYTLYLEKINLSRNK